jgi:hypothetical protein
MPKINEEIEERLARTIVDDEYSIGQTNNSIPDSDYLGYLDMLDCERSEKNYDWMSDIFFPEFFSQMTTQAAVEASELFNTHDYTDVYIGSTEEIHQRAAKVNQEIINRTLNRHKLRFFEKFMRTVMMKNIGGNAYFRCWWEQKLVKSKVGTRRKRKESTTDLQGQPIISDDQVGRDEFVDENIVADVVVHDHFNFDIMDGRDVFSDSSYAHSMQEKRWVILRFEKTVDELEEDEEMMEYFNLERLRDIDGGVIAPHITETKGSKTIHHGLDNKSEPSSTPLKPWTILQRLGKHWVIPVTEDPDGNPITIKSGIGKDGRKLKKAKLREMVITFATKHGTSHKVLIGYNPTRTIDSNGEPYRPIGRPLCYIHPTKDDGIGDGRAAQELQVGINDSLNMAVDRNKLATIPIVQGRQHDITDNESLEWRPGAFWGTDSGEVLTPVDIRTDLNGSMNEINLFRTGMQQASGVSSETQSQLAAPTTTATATANQSSRSDIRSNYRTLTMEFTGLSELYWIITQMTAQYMRPETANAWLGRDMIFFNPTLDYTYKPISASRDTDASKQQKIQNWTQILGYMVNSPNPEAPQAVNWIMGELASLMGKEFETFKNKFLDENTPPPESGGGGGGQVENSAGTPASNQSGVPQSGQEQQVRS